MNDKFSPKNPDDLKNKTRKLVSFEEGIDLTKTSPKPSKYARVLTCTFAKGDQDPSHTQRREPKTVCFPDLARKEKHRLSRGKFETTTERR